MRTSEQINEIAAALALAQGEMKNARLNKTNPHFKSRYADLAEIRDTVTPALSKHGIAVVHGLDTAESGILVVTRLVHKSGQWLESVFPIAYDKPQTMGGAITYGRRYNLSAITNIAADDDDDGNTAAVAPARSKPEPTGTPGASKAKSRELFDKLMKEMALAKTPEALKDWAALRKPEIDKLPEDWMPDFREAYTFRKDSFAAVQS